MSSDPQARTSPSLPPEPGTYFLTFQRQLAASEQISALAKLLAHVHFLYEGWGQVAQPLGAELTRIYTKAACYAVRACSDVEQRVASGKAERWALDHYMDLRLAMLKSPSHEDSMKLLRDFVRGILDEHRFCLMQGCNQLSPRDRLTLAAMNEETPNDPRRI
jgi:hypothetical protein